MRDRISSDWLVDCAYFAVFNAATAMGVAEGKRHPKCSRWLDAFGDVFVDTGRVKPEFFADVRDAFRG